MSAFIGCLLQDFSNPVMFYCVLFLRSGVPYKVALIFVGILLGHVQCTVIVRTHGIIGIRFCCE